MAASRLRTGIVVAVCAAAGWLTWWVLNPAPRPSQQAQTIEGALLEAASRLGPFPRRIDAETEMTGARAAGRTLTYVYRVPAGADLAPQAARLPEMVCAEPSMNAAIRRFGVTYAYEYWSDAAPPVRLRTVAVSACP